jgi:molybdopterin synthase catalytic subunit
MAVRVQHEDFDLGAEVAALRAGNPGVGAVASFIGTVRDVSEGTRVSTMELEHYPGMTEKALETIEAAARALAAAWRDHRASRGPAAAAGPDRAGCRVLGPPWRAFAACEFIMDYLKSEAPFWKKEDTPEGARWVDARVSDDAALRRWGIESFNADPANNKEE